jgi:hypothetical protein
MDALKNEAVNDLAKEIIALCNDVEGTETKMTDFNQLLDDVDAAYVAHNDYFKANEANLDSQRLDELSRRIDQAHDEVCEALNPLDDELRRELTDLAVKRAKVRPRKLRPWVDPKVIREDARKAAAEMKHFGKEYCDNPSNVEMRRERQLEIDSQGGKCAECGEPLDVYQQMMFEAPNMICDTCCIESMDERNMGDRML